jgi:Uncharacterized conserved protein
MSAYIIADVDVTDPQQYEQYKVLSSQAIAAHGAEVCIRGGRSRYSKATGRLLASCC